MDTSNTYFTLQSIHYRIIDSPEEPRIRATAQHPQSLHSSILDSPEERRIRATAQLHTTHRASGAPRIACLGFGKTPYTTFLVFPALCMVERYGFSVTQKGRVSPVRRKVLTLLPRIVRRPQHLPSGVNYGHRNAPRTSCCQVTICRILPDSGSLPPGLYCSAICPTGQTHYSPNYPPPNTRTSSYAESTHSYTAESHNKLE